MTTSIQHWHLDSWQDYWAIHPDDFAAAINAQLKHRRQVEEDLFIALLVSEGLQFWSSWMWHDVHCYAQEYGGGRFLEKLGRALQKQLPDDVFDKLNIFILKNWRTGHELRNKTRAEAVKILGEASFPLSSDTVAAKATYASRVKRLGLARGATSQKPASI